jgi:hypothetical protein
MKFSKPPHRFDTGFIPTANPARDNITITRRWSLISATSPGSIKSQVWSRICASETSVHPSHRSKLLVFFLAMQSRRSRAIQRPLQSPKMLLCGRAAEGGPLEAALKYSFVARENRRSCWEVPGRHWSRERATACPPQPDRREVRSIDHRLLGARRRNRKKDRGKKSCCCPTRARRN